MKKKMNSRRSKLLLFSCLFFLSASPSAGAPAKKVTLAVYYETLCPYCSDFMVNRLANIFTNGLISIVDLHLVPYGNAMADSHGSISCQHGPYECFLNTVEACAISVRPSPQQHFPFVYCIEQLVVNNQYANWESCFQKTGFDANGVINCYNRGYGTKLISQYRAETESLQPPRTFVPWVVVNGKPLYDDSDNFEAYICKAYNGQRPKACQEL